MTTTLQISGMSCTHCAGRVKSALEALDAVEAAEVNHETGSATVTVTKTIPESDFAAAVDTAGYTLVSAG
jgi:copper chaperone CopZ